MAGVNNGVVDQLLRKDGMLGPGGQPATRPWSESQPDDERGTDMDTSSMPVQTASGLSLGETSVSEDSHEEFSEASELQSHNSPTASVRSVAASEMTVTPRSISEAPSSISETNAAVVTSHNLSVDSDAPGSEITATQAGISGGSSSSRLSEEDGAQLLPAARATWSDLPRDRSSDPVTVVRLCEAIARCGFLCPVVGCTYKANTCQAKDSASEFIRDKVGVVVRLPSHLLAKIRLDGLWEHWEYRHVPLDANTTFVCPLATAAGGLCGQRLRAVRVGDVTSHYVNGTTHAGMDEDDATVTSRMMLKRVKTRLGVMKPFPHISDVEWVTWFSSGFEERTKSRYEGPSFARSVTAETSASTETVAAVAAISKGKATKGKKKGLTKSHASVSTVDRPEKKRKVEKAVGQEPSCPDRLPPGSSIPATYSASHGTSVRAARTKQRQTQQAAKHAMRSDPPVKTKWDSTKAARAERSKAMKALTKSSDKVRKSLLGGAHKILNELSGLQSDATLSVVNKLELMKEMTDEILLTFLRQSTKCTALINANGGNVLPSPLMVAKCQPDISATTASSERATVSEIATTSTSMTAPRSSISASSEVTAATATAKVASRSETAATATATSSRQRSETAAAATATSSRLQEPASEKSFSEVVAGFKQPKVAPLRISSEMTSLGKVPKCRHPQPAAEAMEVSGATTVADRGSAPYVTIGDALRTGSTSSPIVRPMTGFNLQPTEREMNHRVGILEEREFHQMYEASRQWMRRLDSFAWAWQMPDSIRSPVLDYLGARGPEHASDADVP